MLHERLEQVVARATEIDAELAEMETRAELSAEDAERVDALIAEGDELASERASLESKIEARARVAAAAVNPKQRAQVMPKVVDGDKSPFDVLEDRFATTADRKAAARSAIEDAQGRGFVPDSWLSAANEKLERKDDFRGTIADLVLVTGSDAYHRGFTKYLAGRPDMMTDEERQAFQRAAMSTTDANGGVAIPFTLDPTLILSNDGVTNPIRAISRVETITTNQWNGVSSAGSTASYDAENAEVSDDSPVFTQPSVDVHMWRAFVQGSIEISQDYRNIAADLATIIMDAKDRLEADKFINGDGTNEPTGVLETVGGTANAGNTVGTAITVANLYEIASALGPRYRPNASWVMELDTLNDIRQFGTSDNYHAFLTDLRGGDPAQLLGRPVYEASEMPVQGSGTASYDLAVYGDFGRGFLIADRVGTSIEFIPHLFNTSNNLPSGTRGWFAYGRNGSKVIDSNAFTTLVTAIT